MVKTLTDAISHPDSADSILSRIWLLATAGETKSA